MESLAKLLRKTVGSSKIENKRKKGRKSSKSTNILAEPPPSSTSSYSRYSVSDFLLDLEENKLIFDEKTSTPVNLNIEPLNRMNRKNTKVASDMSDIKVYEDTTEKKDEKVFLGRKVFVPRPRTLCYSELYENTHFFKDYTKNEDEEDDNEYEVVIVQTRTINNNNIHKSLNKKLTLKQMREQLFPGIKKE